MSRPDESPGSITQMHRLGANFQPTVAYITITIALAMKVAAHIHRVSIN
jgi:hypothetical protein